MDCENQYNLQNVYYNDGKKPFVGLIVGPYFNSSKYVSDLKCFYIIEKKPFEIPVTIVPDREISEECVEKIVKLY